MHRARPRGTRLVAIAMAACLLSTVTGCVRDGDGAASRRDEPVSGAATTSPVSVSPPSVDPAAGLRLVGGDEFDGTMVDQSRWGEYDSAGNDGLGLRRPSQITESGGALTMTCTADGVTGGMMYLTPFTYGLWEARVKASAASGNVHPVLLLWPAHDEWPAGGEVDYMEVFDPARRAVSGFLHYGADNRQTEGTVDVDVTAYNVFAVRWTPGGIFYYVNGIQWFADTDVAHLPPGPMQAAIQLDYFGGPATPGTMTLDWIRIYQ